MSQLGALIILFLSSLLAFLVSLSPLSVYTAQFIALATIIAIILAIVYRQQYLGPQKTYFYSLISFIVCLLIFSTHGLSSPLFFLIYFLLFATALQHPPSTTLAFSLLLILLLSSSLESTDSLLQLVSLLFVTPLVYFVGRQFLENHQLNHQLSTDETDILLWLTLKFKTGIISILDSTSQLLSQPLTPSQKDLIRHIKSSAKSLYHSSVKLTHELDQRTDET